MFAKRFNTTTRHADSVTSVTQLGRSCIAISILRFFIHVRYDTHFMVEYDDSSHFCTPCHATSHVYFHDNSGTVGHTLGCD